MPGVTLKQEKEKLPSYVNLLAIAALIARMWFALHALHTKMAENQERLLAAQAPAEYKIWPRGAISFAIYTDAYEEKGGSMIEFVDLSNGVRTRMPFCSIQSIEEMAR